MILKMNNMWIEIGSNGYIWASKLYDSDLTKDPIPSLIFIIHTFIYAYLYLISINTHLLFPSYLLFL